eukprot:TRINITY_DN1946_c0_g7_i2.p1 TRINITY_DN1946_c0_g7~~TRINITY_DN1946_c0_g7_i2.p1  ORF type:complete len:567 (+),score=120.76 TRINITY_DN1946_c0_g7_i2:128-1828(+)
MADVGFTQSQLLERRRRGAIQGESVAFHPTIQGGYPGKQPCSVSRRQLNAAMLAPSSLSQARYVTRMHPPAPYADSGSRLLHVDWDRQRWMAGVHAGGTDDHPNKHSGSMAASNSSDDRNVDLLLQRVQRSSVHEGLGRKVSPVELNATERYKQQNLNPKNQMHRTIHEWDHRDAPNDVMGWKGVFHEASGGGDKLGGSGHDRYNSLYDMFLAADKDRSGFLDAQELKALLETYLSKSEAEKMSHDMDTLRDGLVSYGEFVRFFHAHESKHRNPGIQANLMAELPIHHERKQVRLPDGGLRPRDSVLKERHMARTFPASTCITSADQEQVVSEPKSVAGELLPTIGTPVQHSPQHGRRAHGSSGAGSSEQQDQEQEQEKQQEQEQEACGQMPSLKPTRRKLPVEMHHLWRMDIPQTPTRAERPRLVNQNPPAALGTFIQKLSEYSAEGGCYKLFLMLDTDRNGSLENYDVAKACNRFGMDPAPVLQALNLVNQDDKLSYSDFVQKLMPLDYPCQHESRSQTSLRNPWSQNQEGGVQPPFTQGFHNSCFPGAAESQADSTRARLFET